jgi:hypothetical protein
MGWEQENLSKIANRAILNLQQAMDEQRARFGGYRLHDLERWEQSDLTLIRDILHPVRDQLMGCSLKVDFRFNGDENRLPVWAICKPDMYEGTVKFIRDLALDIDHETNFAFNHSRQYDVNFDCLGYVHTSGQFAFFTQEPGYTLGMKLAGVTRVLSAAPRMA